ncbi:MAG: hypothetical protein GTN80_10805 [Nitrososphaeria archaeon]|nr:hypothetical protein [Nitrososphaeria archaeon]NIQ34108.1 hypothetical protein [Nitrososphaeria archaeon]
MSRATITVKISRYDPKQDIQPRFELYKVPSEGKTRILDVLEHIYENLDSTLAYRRHLCRGGVCGACRMHINGKPVRICSAPLTEEIVLEPLPQYKVIKDLVVDFDEKRPAGKRKK